MAVDDNPDGAFLTRKALQKNLPGAHVIEFQEGISALKFLETNRVDAIITDYRMAEMEGTTLIAKVRERDQKVPIVMVTGMDHLEKVALAAGANCFVPSSRWQEVPHIVRRLIEAVEAGSVSP